MIELNCLNWTPSIASSLSFSSLRLTTRAAIVQRFGQQLGRQDRGRQSLNGERFNIDFTIAPGDLLQAHADHHALVAGVDHIEYRVTHPGAQLTVQAFIA